MNAELSKLISVVEKVSPLLATAIGASNPIAGMLISILSHVFNVPEAAPDDLANVILGDPNSAEKIKTLEIEQQNAIISATSTNYATEVQDREDARKQDKVWIISFVALIFVFGFFLFIFLILFKEIPDNQETHHIFDVISNTTMLIVSYYFGSCHPANK